ncbi:MAG: TonB-dependent receptor [Gemmatimonadales bacterium]
MSADRTVPDPLTLTRDTRWFSSHYGGAPFLASPPSSSLPLRRARHHGAADRVDRRPDRRQESGAPLAGVQISVLGTGLTGFSLPDGSFELRRVPAGDYQVSIRRLGFEPLTRQVSVRAAAVARLDLEMEALPFRLPGVEVTLRRPDLVPESKLQRQEVREANPRDAGELLRTLPGVEAVRRGPIGLDPVVRGLRETEVGVYLDGTRMFPAGPARMDSPMSHFDPTAVRRMEVVKGPYALTWGAGNLSAIRVETQDVFGEQRGALHGTLQSGYDENLGAEELGASLYGRPSETVSFWAHGAWRQGDDYQAGDGALVPADFVSSEARAKLGLRLAPDSRLTLAAGYQDQGRIDYPGRLLDALLFHTLNLSARYQLARSDGVFRGLDVLGYVNNVDHEMDNRNKPTADPANIPLPFGLDVHVDAAIDVAGGRVAADLVPGDGWRVEIGGDVYRAWRNAVRTIRRRDTEMELPISPSLMWPGATIWDQGTFVRATRTAGGVSLSATARLDLVRADADTISDYFAENVSTALRQTEANLSGAVSLSAALSQAWTLSLGAGSAVRTADATERYSDRTPASKAQISAEFVGNPTLEPERSTQADLWLEGNFPRVSLRLDGFVRRVSNYITIAPTDLTKLLPLSPDVVFQYVNGDADFLGAEGSASFLLADPVTLSVGAAYLWGNDRELDEPVLGVTPLSLDLSLRYDDPSGRFYAEGKTRYLGSQNRVATLRGELPTDATAATIPTGEYATVDLRAGVQPFRGFELRFGVQNLTDKLYADHLNAKNPFSGVPVPEPGRVLFLDAAYSF